MSYGTQQAEHAGYSIHPTPAELDADLADMTDAQVQRYARDLDTAQFQNRTWEVLPVEQRKAIRAANELAKRQHAKERADRQAAEDARVEAQHNARVEAEIAAFEAQARGAFPGTAEQWAAAWPRIREDWQIKQAQERMDANQAAIRARMNSGF
jgi:hypothetical protein